MDAPGGVDAYDQVVMTPHIGMRVQRVCNTVTFSRAALLWTLTMSPAGFKRDVFLETDTPASRPVQGCSLFIPFYSFLERPLGKLACLITSFSGQGSLAIWDSLAN